jgi:hypothetical protein
MDFFTSPVVSPTILLPISVSSFSVVRKTLGAAAVLLVIGTVPSALIVHKHGFTTRELEDITSFPVPRRI